MVRCWLCNDVVLPEEAEIYTAHLLRKQEEESG